MIQVLGAILVCGVEYKTRSGINQKTSKWLITGLEEDLYCEGAVAKQSWLLEPPNFNPKVTSLVTHRNCSAR